MAQAPEINFGGKARVSLRGLQAGSAGRQGRSNDRGTSARKLWLAGGEIGLRGRMAGVSGTSFIERASQIAAHVPLGYLLANLGVITPRRGIVL